jgi:hypothetical protein
VQGSAKLSTHDIGIGTIIKQKLNKLLALRDGGGLKSRPVMASVDVDVDFAILK